MNCIEKDYMNEYMVSPFIDLNYPNYLQLTIVLSN